MCKIYQNLQCKSLHTSYYIMASWSYPCTVLKTAVWLGQLEKQGAGNGTGTGTGTGAGPERYRITSLIRAIQWA